MSERDERYTGDEEVIERNIERSREVIASRKHSENEGKAQKPTTEDPNRPGDTVAPNQWDVPVGGQAGPNFRGGSSKRQKP
jgi:hypothetical protein